MELLVGILAAWGLIMLIWTLTGFLLLPLKFREDISLSVVVQGKGQAPRLEHYLRGLLWIRNLGIVWWNILVIDDDLEEEARQRAKTLTEQETHTAVLPKNMVTDWMDV